MPNYRVEYETWNEYERHVGESYFSFLILPCNTDLQKRNRFTCRNSINEQIYITKNHYGFEQIVFRSLKPFNNMHMQMTCDVHVYRRNPFNFHPLTASEESKIMNTADFQIEHGMFLGNGHYTSLDDAHVPAGWHREEEESVFDYLLRLNKLIHEAFEFTPEITNVHYTANDTMELVKGVCQDLSHVFIAISRKNQIPCRYVSGYLDQGKNFVGSLQMHAWVEAIVPGVGWVGFDPTNNLLQDQHYIKVCHGVDYSECSPIRGVLKSLGDQKTMYEVKVTQQ